MTKMHADIRNCVVGHSPPGQIALYIQLNSDFKTLHQRHPLRLLHIHTRPDTRSGNAVRACAACASELN